VSLLQNTHNVAVGRHDQPPGAVRFLADILQHLFIDHPSPVRTSRLKKVISFFYGNELPLNLAYKFYNACNGNASRFVAEQSREWYYDWPSSRYAYKHHMGEYYSMLFKKFIYNYGSRLNQPEPVLLEVTTMEFGIDHTTHPHKIRRKLVEIQSIEADCA